VPDTAVLDVPVELGLELVAAVGADALDAEGELRDDVFDEVDGIGLVVAAVDLQSPNAGCVIDCGVLAESGATRTAIPRQGGQQSGEGGQQVTAA
jgi:hypothetical protein